MVLIRRRVKLRKILFLSLFLSCTALSQDSNSPASVMQEYVEATKSWTVSSIADLIHPEALAMFRDVIDDALLGEKSERARKELLPLFKVSSYEEFEKISDHLAYQRISEYIGEKAPDLISLMESSNYEIINQITDGDEVVIVYKLTMTVKGQAITQETLQRLKIHENKWYLLLPPSAAASIAGIKAQF